MTGYEVACKREELEKQMGKALLTFEKKDYIYDLRVQLLNLQKECPHEDKEYNFTWTENKCPYCHRQY